jgi:hypothetical protein
LIGVLVDWCIGYWFLVFGEREKGEGRRKKGEGFIVKC